VPIAPRQAEQRTQARWQQPAGGDAAAAFRHPRAAATAPACAVRPGVERSGRTSLAALPPLGAAPVLVDAAHPAALAGEALPRATAARRPRLTGGQALRYPAATGAAIDLLYIPERSKQQARRWPEASLSQAVAIRLTRVSAFLPEVIQWIQSRRATAVMACQVARAAGSAASEVG